MFIELAIMVKHKGLQRLVLSDFLLYKTLPQERLLMNAVFLLHRHDGLIHVLPACWGDEAYLYV